MASPLSVRTHIPSSYCAKPFNQRLVGIEARTGRCLSGAGARCRGPGLRNPSNSVYGPCPGAIAMQREPETGSNLTGPPAIQSRWIGTFKHQGNLSAVAWAWQTAPPAETPFQGFLRFGRAELAASLCPPSGNFRSRQRPSLQTGSKQGKSARKRFQFSEPTRRRAGISGAWRRCRPKRVDSKQGISGPVTGNFPPMNRIKT